MFLIRWILSLLSLPLEWAGQLGRMLHLPQAAGALKLAYAVGGDGVVGQLALYMLLQQEGASASFAQARRWLARRTDGDVAGWAGLMALELQDFTRAAEALRQGRQARPDKTGMLDLLEIHLAERDPNRQQALETIHRLSSRRDLSPAAARSIQVQLMLAELQAQRFGEARDRARRLLDIDQDPIAAIVQWAVARRNGNRVLAEQSLQEAGKLPPEQRLSLMYWAAGRAELADVAQRLLMQAREQYPELARQWQVGGAS